MATRSVTVTRSPWREAGSPIEMPVGTDFEERSVMSRRSVLQRTVSSRCWDAHMNSSSMRDRSVVRNARSTSAGTSVMGAAVTMSDMIRGCCPVRHSKGENDSPDDMWRFCLPLALAT